MIVSILLALDALKYNSKHCHDAVTVKKTVVEALFPMFDVAFVLLLRVLMFFIITLLLPPLSLLSTSSSSPTPGVFFCGSEHALRVSKFRVMSRSG